MANQTHAQDISSHQWQDRLLLILSNDKANATFQKQLEVLRSREAGLQERKLVVYQLSPGEYRKGLQQEGWKPDEGLFEQYKETEAAFEIILIGLDGGVKLRKTRFLSTEELFDRIDSMPMRQEEMRRNKER